MDIIIFAVISGLLFYKLYTILGSNGSDIFKFKNNFIKDVTPSKQQQDIIKKVEDNSEWPNETARIRKYDSKFSEDNFVKGATKAYEMIFEAYNNQNYKNIEFLISSEICKFFKEEILKSSSENQKIEKVITALSKPEIIDIKIEETIATIIVLFKGEQMIIQTNVSDNVSNSRKIKFTDQWKFQKNLLEADPNWKLIEMK